MLKLLLIQKEAEFAVQDMDFVDHLVSKKTPSTNNESSRQSSLHQEMMEVDEQPMNVKQKIMMKRGRHKRMDTLKVLDEIIM